MPSARANLPCCQGTYAVLVTFAMQLAVVLVLVSLTASSPTLALSVKRHTSPLPSTPGNPCSPTTSRLTCIVGCFKCAQAFGRRLYHTTSCCTECYHTQARFVDDGPERCSSRFFTDNFNDVIENGGYILGKR